MKKLLSFFIAVFAFTAISAQVCTPDTSIKKVGLYPRILPDGIAGSQYNETVQFKFPKDTVFSGISVKLDSLKVSLVEGLPDGYSFKCSDSECKYAGGANGCVVISGSPTSDEVGDYRIIITILAKTMFGGAPIWAPFQDTLPLRIAMNSGIFKFASLSQTVKFSVLGNYPNPFDNLTRIVYNSPFAGNVVFKVYDIIGNEIHSEKYGTHVGENSIYFDRVNLKSGIYLYSIQSGDQIITRRMVIQDR